MRRLTVWRLLYRVGYFTQFAALLGATAFGSAQKAGPPLAWGPFWGSVVQFGQEYAWAIPVFGIVGIVAKVVGDYIGPPWVWEAVQKIIDSNRSRPGGEE